ncbi:uncharacterized protein LOC122387013 [Amphibalanus amphitrite]|uniref:uncharacterized protein LOC122387013 n=1 Tax=Amphibalanus amphitrite TaxID=1232801 RepID=UPI001C906DFD|nr:uncharacterized protein LOC122387013 [Amphibalanus amphitrite]
MSVVASDIVFVPSGRYRPDLAALPDRDATGARSSPQEPGQRDPAAAPSARNTRVKKLLIGLQRDALGFRPQRRQLTVVTRVTSPGHVRSAVQRRGSSASRHSVSSVGSQDAKARRASRHRRQHQGQDGHRERTSAQRSAGSNVDTTERRRQRLTRQSATAADGCDVTPGQWSRLWAAPAAAGPAGGQRRRRGGGQTPDRPTRGQSAPAPAPAPVPPPRRSRARRLSVGAQDRLRRGSVSSGTGIDASVAAAVVAAAGLSQQAEALSAAAPSKPSRSRKPRARGSVIRLTSLEGHSHVTVTVLDPAAPAPELNSTQLGSESCDSAPPARLHSPPADRRRSEAGGDNEPVEPLEHSTRGVQCEETCSARQSSDAPSGVGRECERTPVKVRTNGEPADAAEPSSSESVPAVPRAASPRRPQSSVGVGRECVEGATQPELRRTPPSTDSSDSGVRSGSGSDSTESDVWAPRITSAVDGSAKQSPAAVSHQDRDRPTSDSAVRCSDGAGRHVTACISDSRHGQANRENCASAPVVQPPPSLTGVTHRAGHGHVSGTGDVNRAVSRVGRRPARRSRSLPPPRRPRALPGVRAPSRLRHCRSWPVLCASTAPAADTLACSPGLLDGAWRRSDLSAARSAYQERMRPLLVSRRPPLPAHSSSGWPLPAPSSPRPSSLPGDRPRPAPATDADDDTASVTDILSVSEQQSVTDGDVLRRKTVITFGETAPSRAVSALVEGRDEPAWRRLAAARRSLREARPRERTPPPASDTEPPWLKELRARRRGSGEHSPWAGRRPADGGELSPAGDGHRAAVWQHCNGAGESARHGPASLPPSMSFLSSTRGGDDHRSTGRSRSPADMPDRPSTAPRPPPTPPSAEKRLISTPPPSSSENKESELEPAAPHTVNVRVVAAGRPAAAAAAGAPEPGQIRRPSAADVRPGSRAGRTGVYLNGAPRPVDRHSTSVTICLNGGGGGAPARVHNDTAAAETTREGVSDERSPRPGVSSHTPHPAHHRPEDEHELGDTRPLKSILKKTSAPNLLNMEDDRPEWVHAAEQRRRRNNVNWEDLEQKKREIRSEIDLLQDRLRSSFGGFSGFGAFGGDRDLGSRFGDRFGDRFGSGLGSGFGSAFDRGFGSAFGSRGSRSRPPPEQGVPSKPVVETIHAIRIERETSPGLVITEVGADDEVSSNHSGLVIEEIFDDEESVAEPSGGAAPAAGASGGRRSRSSSVDSWRGRPTNGSEGSAPSGGGLPWRVAQHGEVRWSRSPSLASTSSPPPELRRARVAATVRAPPATAASPEREASPPTRQSGDGSDSEGSHRPWYRRLSAAPSAAAPAAAPRWRTEVRSPPSSPQTRSASSPAWVRSREPAEQPSDRRRPASRPAAATHREAPDVSAILSEVAELRQRARRSPDPAEPSPAASWRHQRSVSPGSEETARQVPRWRHQPREAPPTAEEPHRPTSGHQRTSPLSNETSPPSSTWLNAGRSSPISEEVRRSPQSHRAEREVPAAESARPPSWATSHDSPSAQVTSTPLSDSRDDSEHPKASRKVLVLQEEIEIHPPSRSSEPQRQDTTEEPPPIPPHGDTHRQSPKVHGDEHSQPPPVPPHATPLEPLRTSDLHWRTRQSTEAPRLVSDSHRAETTRHSPETQPAVMEIHVEREKPSQHSSAPERVSQREIPVQHEKSSHQPPFPEKATHRQIPVHQETSDRVVVREVPVHHEKSPRHSSVPGRARVVREEHTSWHRAPSPEEGTAARSAAQREKQQLPNGHGESSSAGTSSGLSGGQKAPIIIRRVSYSPIPDQPASGDEQGRSGSAAVSRRRPTSPSPARRPAAERTAERAGRRGTPHGTPELARRTEERQERQSRPRQERRAFPPPGTSLTSRPRSLDPTRLRQEGRAEPAGPTHSRTRTPDPPRSRPPDLPRSRPAEQPRSLGESIGLRVESALERLLTSGGVPASPKASPRGQRAAAPNTRRPGARPTAVTAASPSSSEAKRQRRQPGEVARPSGRPRAPSTGTGSGSSTPTQQRRPEVRTTRTTVVRQKAKSQPLSVPAVVTRAVLISGAPLTDKRNGVAASELVRRTLASSGTAGQQRTSTHVTTNVTERARRGRDGKDGVKRIVTKTEVITGAGLKPTKDRHFVHGQKVRTHRAQHVEKSAKV